jgi:hypothetical protein
MPYHAEINRANPSAFVFLLDQSESMKEPFPAAPGKRKANGLADAINRMLQSLILRCSKSEGVRDYYHVAVIGYGKTVGPAWEGALAGKRLVPISAVANNLLRVEERSRQEGDGAGGVFTRKIKFRIWIEPRAEGMTPMCAALDLAWHLVSEFLVQSPACYPPILINITDGAATDGNPEPRAEMLRQLASDDGPVLFFNAHLSSRSQTPIEFPDEAADLPDDYARMLFRMSSVLPPPLAGIAAREGFRVGERSKRGPGVPDSLPRPRYAAGPGETAGSAGRDRAAAAPEHGRKKSTAAGT